MFAYCGNNPQNVLDPYGKDWEWVGVGVQLDFSGSVGEIAGGGGVEVIIYWGIDECDENGGPIVVVYSYLDANIDLSAFSDDIKAITNLLLENVDLLKMDGATTLQALSCKQLSFSASMSASFFAVFGNEQFKVTENYTEAFSNVSLGISKAKISAARSDCCVTLGLGWTLWEVSTNVERYKISPYVGRSYYWQWWTSSKVIKE